MKSDRRRQVRTTKLRHGRNFYKKNGRKPHRRGFSDPEVARAAALKSHEARRLNKLQRENQDATAINSEEN